MNFVKKMLTDLVSEKRIMSFAWQVMMMMLAWFSNYILLNLTGLGIENPAVVTGLGIILAQISKAANNALSK